MPLKKLHELVFPVYRLRAYVDFYTNALGLRIIEGLGKTWVLDDTNMSESYPIRRIKMLAQGRDVYPLTDMYDTLSRIVHHPSGTEFIDSEGYVFEYRKGGVYWDLQYHKIESMVLAEDANATIVKVQWVTPPFIFHTVLNTQMKYIGLLSKAGMYIPYDLSTTRKASTRRML